MKTPNYFWVVTIVIAANLFVSCSSKKTGFFSNSYPQYAHKEQPKPTEALAKQSSMPAVAEKTFIEKYGELNETEGKISLSQSTPVPRLRVKVLQSKASNSETGLTPVKKLSKIDKQHIKHAIKKENTNRTGIGTLLLVIIAIILPPLAVLLVDSLNGPFWLDLLLTILFYIPGLIYALWRVFREEN